MDPDACLKELLDLALDIRQHLNGRNERSEEEFKAMTDDLVSHVFALHGWMMGRGFLPKQWQVADKG